MTDQDKEKSKPQASELSSPEVELKVSPSDSVTEENNPSSSPEQNKAEELIGKTLDEKYEIHSYVGRGGLGMVYKAKHTITNTDVAIKVLLPDKSMDGENLARFKREAKTAMVLKHPNIAGVQDMGFYESMPYIVMEFVDGKALYDLLKEDRLSTKDKVSILKQVLEAMEYARQNEVVHRDLKPDNIIVSYTKTGELKTKIVDFGIAKVLDAKEEVTLTKTGEMFGTPLYMSPEQIQGEKTDHRSDIYSIGCIAYEFVSGQAPFKSDSALAILNAHLEEEVPKLKVPDDLKGMDLVITKSLCKDKAHRYQTAKDMLTEIERVEKGQKPLSTKVPVSKKTTKRILIACIGLCLFVLIGLLAFLQAFKLDTINSFSDKIRSNPKDVIALIGRGRLYAVGGQYQNAISDFDKAIKYADDKSNKAMAYVRKASAQIALNNYDQALITVNKGISIKPEFYRGYLVRARIAQFKGKNDKALEDFKKSIELNNVVGPQQINIAISSANMANIYANQKEWKKSIESADKALERFKGYEFAYISKARSHLGLGQLKECVEDCNKILLINAKSKAALQFRGTAYSGLKMYQKALNDFDEWISVDPENPTAYVKRAQALRLLEKIDKAKSSIDRAFELGAKSYTAYYELAEVLKAQKNYSEALAAIDKAIAIKSSKSALRLKESISKLLN